MTFESVNEHCIPNNLVIVSGLAIDTVTCLSNVAHVGQ